jgi:hypothetical protein
MWLIRRRDWLGEESKQGADDDIEMHLRDMAAAQAVVSLGDANKKR